LQFETIVYEKRDRVATITLNRPERLNAVNGVMSRELPRAWADVIEDPDVSVVIVTAAGEKSFCTGFDMLDAASNDTAEVGDEGSRGTLDSIRFTAIQNECWKPVITAVNGMVTGGGLHFIADSDLVVAAEHATFFDNHVRVGMVSGLEPVGLIRRLGMEAVLRMSFLGGAERMSAEIEGDFVVFLIRNAYQQALQDPQVVAAVLHNAEDDQGAEPESGAWDAGARHRYEADRPVLAFLRAPGGLCPQQGTRTPSGKEDLQSGGQQESWVRRSPSHLGSPRSGGP